MTEIKNNSNSKWISENRERWNEICRINMKKYYANNKEVQKEANNKWINNNREKWNETCNINMKVYYEKNKDDKKKKSIDRYYVNKEFERFRNILL